MCQKIWAGVSSSLPIPKLTQYIQFVKVDNKFGQGPPPSFGQNPKEQLLFFRETFPKIYPYMDLSYNIQYNITGIILFF